MSILFDAASSSVVGYNASATIAHALGAGTNRVMVACGAQSGPNDKVTGVTFNGVAMVRAAANAGGLATASTYIYTLAIADSLAAGTYNVVWTYSSGDVAMECRNASFSGVDATTPFSATNGANTSSQASPESLSITVLSGGFAVDVISGTVNTDPFMLGAGQTEIGTQGSAITIRGAASYQSAATAMGWTWVGGTRQIAHTVIALKPAGASDTTAPTMSGSVASSAITSSGFTLTWPAASDNVAVTGYEVSLDNGTTYTNVGNVLTITETGLAASTLYHTKVRAYDAAGNRAATPLALDVATTAAAGAGSFATPVLKNNTGTILANETGVTVNVYSATTGALVVRKTGLTSSSGGIVTVSDAALVSGTTYAYEVVLTSNGRRLPTAAAA